MIIINTKKPNHPLRIVNELLGSEFIFYLCGSHLYEKAHGNSDLDFFALYDEKIVKYLESLQFKESRIHAYLDSNTATIYEKDNIDIILVHDPDLRVKFQNFIIDKKINIPKGNTAFCNMIYHKVKATEEEARKIV